MVTIILLSVAVIAGLGIIFGIGLGVASKKLAVPVDERVSAVRELLPGANCGGCGFPGCDGFASAVVEGAAKPNGCAVCSAENAAKIGDILGVAVESGPKKYAHVMCRGKQCINRASYVGVSDCRGAILAAGGFKACKYGCLGLGTCAKSCPFGGIKVGENGFAEVDRSVCTGCGACVDVCPVHIISLVDDHTTYVACHSHGFGKAVMSICPSGCIGCKLCEKNCPEKAITMVDNLPVIDENKCIGCGICAQKCKPGCIIPQAKLSPEQEKAAIAGDERASDIIAAMAQAPTID